MYFLSAPELRRLRLGGGTAIKSLARFRHVDEQAGRRETVAVLLGELVAEQNEIADAHSVDIAQRAAGIRCKAEAEDRADIRLARIGDHPFLEGARGLNRLHDEDALLQFLDVDRIRVELALGEIGKSRPEPLLALALLGIIVEALAVLAAVAAL